MYALLLLPDRLVSYDRYFDKQITANCRQSLFNFSRRSCTACAYSASHFHALMRDYVRTGIPNGFAVYIYTSVIFTHQKICVDRGNVLRVVIALDNTVGEGGFIKESTLIVAVRTCTNRITPDSLTDKTELCRVSTCCAY